MPTLRTFIAVEISRDVRVKTDKLVGLLTRAPATVNWVEPENRHWTLQFLGDVDVNQTHAVCKAVAAATEGIDPFELQAVGAGAFPDAARPRTLWIGAGQGRDQIIALQEAVEEALSELGFAPERRPYQPHLTLGRAQLRQGGLDELREQIEQQAEFDAGASTVKQAVIFSSERGRDGPVYHVLGRAPLGGK
jgi:2'-5' RNA ligase